MSVLIKGMEMPKDCAGCQLRFGSYCTRLTDDNNGEILLCVNKEIVGKTRNKRCPLVEVPTPHGRLIDADKLIQLIKNRLNEPDAAFGYDTVDLFADIENFPTIIEAEK